MRILLRPFFFVSFVAGLLVFAGCSLGTVSTTTTNTVKNIANANIDLDNANSTIDNSNANTNSNTNASDEDANANVNTSDDTNSNENTNTNTEVTADPGEEEEPAVVASTDPAAKDRDKVRVADVEKLQAALKKYFDAKKSYPDTLEGLVPTYISELPKNPAPGGSEYTYTPIGSLPASFYDLTYTLEAGVNDIEAGLHSATPKGIAQP